jgi:hypothetical protein
MAMSAEQTKLNRETPVEIKPLSAHPTFEEWETWFNARNDERARKAHEQFVALERSNYHPQGWNPMLD